MEKRSKLFDPQSIKIGPLGKDWHQYLPWVYVAIVLVSLALVSALFWPVLQRTIHLQKQKEALQINIEKGQIDTMKVQDELARLQQDPDYVERLARDVLNLGKPGETIFRFPPYAPEQSKEGVATLKE
jgi:cell division protein DivIC